MYIFITLVSLQPLVSLQEFLRTKPDPHKQEPQDIKPHIKSGSARDISNLFQISATSQQRDTRLGLGLTDFDTTSGSSGSHGGVKRPRSDEGLGGYKSKRQRRSGGTKSPRLSDVFDVDSRRKAHTAIRFNILGRSQEVLKSAVGRPAKKMVASKSASTSGHHGESKLMRRLSAVGGSSDYRNICLKLKPFGKAKRKLKSVVSSHTSITGFPL